MKDLDRLERYPFCGHGVIMGRFDHEWQESRAVLACFGKRVSSARGKYKAFVAQGLEQGKRADLTGGGLLRSAGGWAAVKAMRKAKVHIKSDERILGDGDFVSQVLAELEDSVERRYALQARGVDVDYIAGRVADLLEMPVAEVWKPGRYKHLVAARSLICFWAVRELGISMASLARRFNISTVAVSKSVARGAGMVEEKGYELI